MSPSRAGSSPIARAEGVLARLVTFFTSACNLKIGLNQAEIQLAVEDLFLIHFYNKLVLKMTKSAAKSSYLTLKTPFVLTNVAK